jgi:predicted ester cyclase
MTTQQTQTEQNKSLVRRYYEEVGNAVTADIASAGADRLLSNDFTFYPPNAAEGEQSLDIHKEFLHWHHGVAPNQHWIPEEMIAEGDKIAVRFTTHGTQQGEFLGVAPAGKPFTLRGMDLFRITGGKVVELRRYFDVMAMMEQIGAGSAPQQGKG